MLILLLGFICWVFSSLSSLFWTVWKIVYFFLSCHGNYFRDSVDRKLLLQQPLEGLSKI